MEFLQQILSICGAISIVGGAGAIVVKVIRPAFLLTKRVSQLEVYNDKDYKKLQSLEDMQKQQSKCLAAMLNHQISLGQKFLIYSLSDEEIIDPDTNQSLGYLEIVKGTGIVTHVQEKLCTLESDVYHSSSRKVIRTSPFAAFGSSTEEIESNKAQEPFNDARTGDFAKRVN